MPVNTEGNSNAAVLDGGAFGAIIYGDETPAIVQGNLTVTGNLSVSGALPIGGSGYSGYSGKSGYSGISGYSGANPGASGYSGYSGTSGYSGANPGASGYSGKSGYSGYSGYSGTMLAASYVKASLPGGVTGDVIYVSDATGAHVTGSLAFYNGTSWIDVTTGVAVA